MSRASKYKYEKGDEVGLYRVIRPLPSEPNVKNLVIYCECLLCGEKVKRWSNRLDSKHRGCNAEVKIEKTDDPAEPIVVTPKPHVRDGKPVPVKPNGFLAKEVIAEATADLPDDDADESFAMPSTIDLPPEVAEALSSDIDQQAIEIIALAKGLDPATNFVFINTFRRYIYLLHLARRLENKITKSGELTVIGSTGSQVANPLIVQYKQVSSESNSTITQLLKIVRQINSGDQEDPLAKILAGAEA